METKDGSLDRGSVAADAASQAEAAVPLPTWWGDEGHIAAVAVALCERDGEDPFYLIWEGGTVPEPWGEVWQRREREAEDLIKLVTESHKLAAAAYEQALASAAVADAEATAKAPTE